MSDQRRHSRRACARRSWVLALAAACAASPAHARQAFSRTADRGPGVSISMFGIYIEPGELLVYPFFEYYRDSDAEYSPEELGYGLDQDFRGRYRASEGLLFLGYGISRRLAVEFEAAVISASQTKSADDPSSMPSRIEESGLGDVEGQLRWRWKGETASGRRSSPTSRRCSRCRSGSG